MVDIVCSDWCRPLTVPVALEESTGIDSIRFDSIRFDSIRFGRLEFDFEFEFARILWSQRSEFHRNNKLEETFETRRTHEDEAITMHAYERHDSMYG